MTMFVTASRTSYVNRLALHHARMEAIAAPYLSDLELKKLRSDYVQVNSRSLYVQHIDKLDKIIRDNGRYAPYQYFF